MSNIIIVYSTTDGHTRKICRYLRQVIEKHGHQVSIISVDDETLTNLEPFDKIVVGASVRYGKHDLKIRDFARKHSKVLEKKPNAFFSVNVVARKPDKNRPETNPYLKSFLKQISWKPQILGVFAGKINYRQYDFLDRNLIRLIMWMTNGPTDPETNIEFTNWSEVDDFGRRVSEMF